MEVSGSTTISTSNENKYRKVYPIIGLLLYYLGSLIAGLEVANAAIFLVEMLAFSIILIIGLAIARKEIIILGEVIAIIGSVGPVVEFLITAINGDLFGYSAFGGGIILISDIFFILGILVWFRK